MTVSRYRSVRKAAGIIFIVARRCVVIIAVLVVNTEFVAEIMHRIDKRFHAFETIIWIEAVDETLWMEWIPLCEEGLHPVKVLWPTAMEFTNGRDDWYTLLTEGQEIGRAHV